MVDKWKPIYLTDPGMSHPRPHPTGHADPYVAEMLEILTTWFWDIEEGTASWHLPDPEWQPLEGRKEWTEERVNKLIDVIEDYLTQQLGWSRLSSGLLATAGPGFTRLAYPQRLALAQELDSVEGEAPPKQSPAQQVAAAQDAYIDELEEAALRREAEAEERILEQAGHYMFGRGE